MGLFKRHGKLSPKARAKKYHQELKNKVETGVNGHIYTDDYGVAYELSDTQLAYRSGYVNARKDIRLASKRKKAKNGKKGKKKNYGKSSYGNYGKSNWKKADTKKNYCNRNDVLSIIYSNGSSSSTR